MLNVPDTELLCNVMQAQTKARLKFAHVCLAATLPSLILKMSYPWVSAPDYLLFLAIGRTTVAFVELGWLLLKLQMLIRQGLCYAAADLDDAMGTQTDVNKVSRSGKHKDSQTRINKFAMAFPSVSKLYFPIRHDNESEIAFFWSLKLQLNPKSAADFANMALQWNTILSTQLGQTHFRDVYPKKGLLLKKFDREISTRFMHRESFKLSRMLQGGRSLHSIPSLSSGTEVLLQSTPNSSSTPASFSAGPHFLAAQPLSQAAVALDLAVVPPQLDSPPPALGPATVAAVFPSPNPAARKKPRAQATLSTWAAPSQQADQPSQAPTQIVASGGSGSTATGRGPSKCPSCQLYAWFQLCKQKPGSRQSAGFADPADVPVVEKKSHQCPRKDLNKLFGKAALQDHPDFHGWTKQHVSVLANYRKGRPNYMQNAQ